MNDTWLLIAIILTAGSFGALEVARNARFKKLQREQQDGMRRLLNDVQAICTGAINMGNQIDALEKKLRRLTERQDQLDSREPMEQVYAHAIRLAQRGADVNELVESCGLARGEAELLLRVHSVRRCQAGSA